MMSYELGNVTSEGVVTSGAGVFLMIFRAGGEVLPDTPRAAEQEALARWRRC